MDGIRLNKEHFVRSEIFFGKTLEDRKAIFENILPDEVFIDRRIHVSG